MIVSHNNQKKIAVINDFSGFGRCSIAVSLPIISAMKIQCCPVPTSIFSNHTGFDSYFFEDYTDKMRPYIAEWRKLDLHFNGICTGFLGSEAQIGIVGDFLQEFGGEGTIVLIDPVMGDYGKAVSDLYYGNVSGNEKTGALCRHSDTESDGGMHSDRHTL